MTEEHDVGINIFQVEGEEETQRSSELVGRFRSGYQADNRPVALKEFRVTTGDPEVASAIAELLGADEEPSKWDTKTDENIQVFTTTKSVDIIVDGEGAIRATLVLWGQGGKIVETDGTHVYDDDGNLTDEECSFTAGKTRDELKRLHRAKKGPGPSLQAYFTLADGPELGKFKFFSGSWSSLDNFAEESDRLAELEGPQRYTLELKPVEFEKDGEKIQFTKPVLKHQGPVEAAS